MTGIFLARRRQERREKKNESHVTRLRAQGSSTAAGRSSGEATSCGTVGNQNDALSGILLRAMGGTTAGGIKLPDWKGVGTGQCATVPEEVQRVLFKIQAVCEESIPRRPCGVKRLILPSNAHVTVEVHT